MHNALVNMDIREITLEEIALEGLDGITIPTLWLRMENCEPRLPFALTDAVKEFIWKFIVQHPLLEIYKIPTDRQEPQIFDRFADQEQNAVPVSKAPDELGTLVEVYSSDPVSDVAGVRGACSNYNDRSDVGGEISRRSFTLAESVEFYGPKKLVIVASQNLRENALLHTNIRPTVLSELTDVAYCVLERVGRARWQGELQAILNKLSYSEKSYHIHYVINKLNKYGLVVKKNHTYKRPDKNGRTCFQVLVHLSKFERDCRTYSTRTMDSMIEMLKASPNRTLNLGELREKLQVNERAFKVIYGGLQRSGEVVVWDLNPEKRAKSIYSKAIALLGKGELEDTGDDNEDEDIQNMFTSPDSSLKPIVLEEPLLYQTYAFIVENGEKGVTQRQVLKFLKGYGHLEARNICKMFGRMKLVNIVLVDHGKQRTQTFIPKNLSCQNLRSLEFSDEKKKMRELLVETAKIASEKESSGACDEQMMELGKYAIQTSTDDAKFRDPAKLSITAADLVEIKDEFVNESEDSKWNEKMDADSPADRLNSILQDKTSGHYHTKKWDAHLTTRKIRRHNIILKQLNEEKIIEGYRTLQKTLTKAEEGEGVKTKIDKKTVVRLVDKMHLDGVLKHSVIPITHNGRTEDFHFIMALDCPAKLLKSAVDQARFKFLGDEENRIARMEQKTLKEEMKEQKMIRKAEQESLLDPKYQESLVIAGRERTARKLFLPKFKRLRAVHELLWYLLYGHPESKNWTPDMGITDPDEVRSHCSESSWKRFLPPAPIHFHDGLRWLQVGDVAVILPLSLFCQFHRVTHEVEGLELWLSDEEKRHTLIRHLPQKMRSVLLYKRRYMFSLMLCIEQLVFVGLLTMRRGRSGRNCNMPKENMMIYVHKNATLYDTRSSSKQHVKVEPKDYEKIKFTFEEFANVEEYWFKLQEVCVNTRLGFVEYQEPDYDIIKDHLGTTELKKFIQTINETQPKPDDNGQIPGDQRGAAGLDSSLYSYLYRNWNSKSHLVRGDFRMRGEALVTRAKRLPKLNETNLTLSASKKKTLRSQLPAANEVIQKSVLPLVKDTRKVDSSHKSTDMRGTSSQKGGVTTATQKKSPRLKMAKKRTSLESGKKDGKHGTVDAIQVVTVNNIGRNDRVKGGRGVKRKKGVEVLNIPMKKLRMEVKRRRRKPQMVPQGRQRIKYVDKNDLNAIKSRKGRLRVNFTSAEDALLLICHIALTLITHLYWKKRHRPRKRLIPWSIVRDISQKALPEASDKTSFSVGRRTYTILKNSETRICHDISVADIKTDKDFLQKSLPRKFDLETENHILPEIYRTLVKCLQARFKTQPGLFSNEMPDTARELFELYSPKTISKKVGDIQKKRRLFRDEITNTVDIARAVAENMIHVALTMEDMEFSDYPVSYRFFEAFPENVLSEVVALMQVSGFVSTKHDTARRLPFGVRPHRLAQAHLQTLRATVPHKAIDQVCEAINNLSDTKLGAEIPVGQIFLISYLLLSGPVDFTIEIPEQMILPDVPNASVFENQFLSMIKKTKDEILKEVHGENLDSSGGASLPPTSLMAAAACALKDDLEDDAEASKDERDPTSKDESDDTKLKLAEVLKLYNRHPSYTNWLMLINPNRRSGSSESKFANLNYSVISDSVVLSPCSIALENTRALKEKYIFESATFENHDSKTSQERITQHLRSMEINFAFSEKSWKLLEDSSTPSKFFILKSVYDTIDNSVQFGIADSEVCAAVAFNKSTVLSTIAELLEKRVIFSVGVSTKKYVSYKHVKPWTAKGFRYCGDRPIFRNKISHEVVPLEHASSKKKKNSDTLEKNTVESSENSSELKENETELPQLASRRKMNNYEEVNFICRPWHTIGGGISFKSAKSLLKSVYLKILSSPGITKEQLCASFSFQPICIMELLEILCKEGCVTEHIVEVPGPKRLFGAPSCGKTITYYETTHRGLVTISQWCEMASEVMEKQK